MACTCGSKGAGTPCICGYRKAATVSLDLDPMPRLLAAGYRESAPVRKPLCGRQVLSGSLGCWCEHWCNG